MQSPAVGVHTAPRHSSFNYMSSWQRELRVPVVIFHKSPGIGAQLLHHLPNHRRVAHCARHFLGYSRGVMGGAVKMLGVCGILDLGPEKHSLGGFKKPNFAVGVRLKQTQFQMKAPPPR
jgi:hypothetical protein